MLALLMMSYKLSIIMSSSNKWICKGSADRPHRDQAVKVGDVCIQCGAQNITVPTTRSEKKPNVAAILGIPTLIALIAGGVYGYMATRPAPSPTPSPIVSPTNASACPLPSLNLASDQFSVGGQELFQENTQNQDLNRGIDEFKKENYTDAINYFRQAIQSARTDPEPQIYLNNAEARLALQQNKSACPLTIAAVVPIKNRAQSAQEILRGIADAQTQFYQTKPNRQLEVLIVNDGNEKETAEKVAKEISQHLDILAVIGHNSSEASIAALPSYKKVSETIAMVSPTSTSKELKSDIFFRAVPSNVLTAPALVNYITKQLKANKIAIFYDSKSGYSSDLLDELKTKLDPTMIAKEIDIASPNLDAKQAIADSIDAKADTILLLPSTQSISVAIRVAQENQGRLKLLGGDALYSPTTLTDGGLAVKDLTLVVPIAPSDSYAKESEKRWGGNINWRTVSSSDAAQAVIQAIEALKSPQNVSRQDIINKLKSTTFTTTASGSSWNFTDGERGGEPCIVQADKNAPAPQGAEFGFRKIQCGN